MHLLLAVLAANNPSDSGLDPSVQVALVGILTTIVTTGGVVLVALANNKKERGAAAESAIVATLRERITLRDEQIMDLKTDILDRDRTIEQLLTVKDEQISDLREDIVEKDKTIRQLRESLELRKDGR